MDEIVFAFGRAVRRLRLEKQMTQEHLGFEANLQRKYISSLELGQKQPTLTTVFKIAVALQLPASKLISIVEDELSN